MRLAVLMHRRRNLTADGSTPLCLPRLCLFLCALSALAGCATPQTGQKLSALGGGSVDSRYGVRASPRVVADGDSAPQGGGRYHVGKPYQIAGKTYYPSEKPIVAVGSASWYGADFHGRLTANGEVFDRNSVTAAHPTMPLPSYCRVTNTQNTRSIVVRVNDRGPYHGGRVMDVSQRVAEALDFKDQGTARVKIEWLGRAEIGGSSNARLLASLRTDGQPAILDGFESPIMTAERSPVVRTAYAAPTQRAVSEDAELRPSRNEEAELSALAQDAVATKDNQDGNVATAKSRGSEKTTPMPVPPVRPFDLGDKSDAASAKN